jgi:hypothetical protein
LILQPHLINKRMDTFNNEVSDKRISGTSATSRFKVTCPEEGSDTIHGSVQKIIVQA